MTHRESDREDRSAEAPLGDERLLRIAEAIADRSPVDWRQEIEETPLADSSLRDLETIDLIAAFHSGTTPIMEEEVQGENLPATWGNLIVRECLGTGTCANVFRAYDPALDREVALKLPHRRDSAFAHSFLREARRLAKIHHEGVVQIHGADECDGRVGMWMDLVEGLNLKQYVATHGPLSAKEATLTGIEICRALAAVHGAGLLHRDLKESNVMREEGGRIVLMDFSSVVETVDDANHSDDSSTRGCGRHRSCRVRSVERRPTVFVRYSSPGCGGWNRLWTGRATSSPTWITSSASLN